MISILLLVLVGNNCATANNQLKNLLFDVEESRLHPFNEPTPSAANPYETDASYWNNEAQIRLASQLARLQNTGIAKNVIFFIGDGMSIPTLSAARAHLGQRNGQTGEEVQLSFEKFPYVGLSKTYCVDNQVADSACSATAYLGGVKGNKATIGVSGAVKLNDCDSMNNVTNQVLSVAYHAQQNNKRTGLVTTTRVTHASPAGVYSHVANRKWEADSNVILSLKDPKNVKT